MSRRLGQQTQDADESLPYSIDWTPDIDGSSIISSQWSVRPSGTLQITDASFTTSVTTMRVSGGTPGINYETENTITTAAGSTYQGHIYLTIVN